MSQKRKYPSGTEKMKRQKKEEEKTRQDKGMFACLGNVPPEKLGNTGSKKRVE